MKYSPRVIINYVIFTFLFAGAAIMIAKSAADSRFTLTAADSGATPESAHRIVFVIDPGHGGEDGGASSGDILEKDLNLSVSEVLADLCTVFGYNAQLTRSSDTLLYDYYDDLENYTGRKKAYDLRNRLRIAEESGAQLFIGIHMNKFPEEKYKGLQVYYSPNTDESKVAASFIQSYNKKYVAPDNDRAIKCATKSIFILKRIKIPAVLVECGFLSNPEECAALTTPEYKVALASSIFAACAEYTAERTK